MTAARPSRRATRLAVLGSTGSIGVNALDVVRLLNRRGPRFEVSYLASRNSVDLLKKQAHAFRPRAVVVADPRAFAAFRDWAKRTLPDTAVWPGVEGLERAASAKDTDLVVAGVVGSVGVRPLWAAVKAGKKVALANKEALIAAGGVVTAEARRTGATLIPVDSEHSAIFQCLLAGVAGQARRLILTASGGAFYRRKNLRSVSVEDALDHPTWRMGKKITVDCATLMNKGLEAIEAHHLFGMAMDDIHIVVHPQSIVHSAVEFADGSVVAQLSHPDMRLPIQYALTHPDREPSRVRTLHLEEMKRLDFDKPDFRRFPCLALALEAGRKGGTWPAVLNGANEAAVAAFLARRIGFMDIPDVVRAVMGLHRPPARLDLDAVLAADVWAREQAEEAMTKRKARV